MEERQVDSASENEHAAAKQLLATLLRDVTAGGDQELSLELLRVSTVRVLFAEDLSHAVGRPRGRAPLARRMNHIATKNRDIS